MLTPDEKVAGRRFRDQAQAELLQSFVDNPPTYTVPNFLALYRHNCAKRDGRSTALELKEVYRLSSGYHVFHLKPPIAVCEDEPQVPVETLHTTFQHVPAGRFAFITREGRCRGCGQTARAKAGRLVDARERPPIQGRVARS